MKCKALEVKPIHWSAKHFSEVSKQFNKCNSISMHPKQFNKVANQFSEVAIQLNDVRKTQFNDSYTPRYKIKDLHNINK